MYLLDDLNADDVNLLSIEKLKLSSRAVENSLRFKRIANR